jgi:hypothetical protein
MKKTTPIDEALVVLYRGQSNVRLMAVEAGIPFEEMKQLFREYVAKTPIEPDAWQDDIEIAWPYSGN